MLNSEDVFFLDLSPGDGWSLQVGLNYLNSQKEVPCKTAKKPRFQSTINMIKKWQSCQ